MVTWLLPLLAVALIAPAIGIAYVVARRPVAAPFDELRRATTTLRTIRWARAHVCALASYAVVLWFCQAGSMIHARAFVAAYTVMLGVALAAYLPWLRRLERRALERCANCRASIEDLKHSTGW